MYPTSGQYLLSAGDYDAAVTQVGAALPRERGYVTRSLGCFADPVTAGRTSVCQRNRMMRVFSR